MTYATRGALSRLLLSTFMATLCLASFTTRGAVGAEKKPQRPDDCWFYVSCNPDNEERTDFLISLIERGSSVGYNGMLWATAWEGCGSWSAAKLANVERVKASAKKANVELIPILWSIGYGTMIAKDPNLAEGLLVEDLPLKVEGNVAAFQPDDAEIPNGGMETWKNNKLTEIGFHDKPNEISFRDEETKRSGNSSVRFENLASDQHGHGRLMTTVKVKPNRVYRVSVWMKLEGFVGNDLLQVYRTSGEQMASTGAATPVKPDADGTRTSDWSLYTATFRAPEEGEVRIYLGAWNGKTGKLWADDLTIEPLGLVNPLRRDGTPFVVRNADRTVVYEEGKDWILPEFNLRGWDRNAPSQKLTIPAGSRVKDGDVLSVDFYAPAVTASNQLGTCMSEPKLYKLFEEDAQDVARVLGPKKWFLSMDEIRCGGSCESCKKRGLSLAQILADCVAKQRAIIKNVDPDAEIYIWSDMFDPNHNAHDDYYVCEGDYTGVWDMIPKDLIISCWYYEKRDDSLKFFSERGFKTQGAAYYDKDDLKTSLDWFDSCDKTPGCVGVMYTTWRNKYELLEDFGKAAAERKK